jgi:hypothetical protein
MTVSATDLTTLVLHADTIGIKVEDPRLVKLSE